MGNAKFNGVMDLALTLGITLNHIAPSLGGQRLYRSSFPGGFTKRAF